MNYKKKNKKTYYFTKCCVQTKYGTTEWFDPESRVRQGSVLAPLLFNIAMNEIRNWNFSTEYQATFKNINLCRWYCDLG